MTNMRLGWGVVALALTGCCFRLDARQLVEPAVQTPSGQTSSQAFRTITGTVVNSVTGEPIRRALVQINGSRQGSAFTGADGRFQIDNVPAVNAFSTVSAQKPGFFDPSQMGGNHAPVTVPAGSNEVLLKLDPQCGIQGRIVDGDGEPIEGIQVQLMAEQIGDGRKAWQPRESAQTRENGTYRMENLIPGTYVIHTLMRPEFVFQSGQGMGQVGQQQAAYPERFYPNSPDLVTAQPIDLKPGEQAQADFTLSSVRAFAVSGSVIPAEQGFVSIESGNGQPMWSPVMSSVQVGRFRLATVPAGSWILTFHGNNGQRGAEQLVNVGSSDVDGVQLQIQSLASIPIDVSGAPDAAAMPVQIQLVSKEKQRENMRYMPLFAAPGNSQQSVKIDNVPPGRYTVLAQPNGSGCIDSISSGSIDLTRSDLTVGSDAQPAINVRLRQDCPSAGGTVRAETGSASGVVILLPSAAFIEPKTTPIQSDGHFDFGTLSPGEYRVYAFSNIEGLEYANPEAMHDFAGQQIDLQPNQKANVALDLIVRGNR